MNACVVGECDRAIACLVGERDRARGNSVLDDG